MNKRENCPEFSEYNGFRLTDEQRTYFGLDKIDEQWEEVEVKTGTTVFYEGNIIRKIITWDNFNRFEYRELDTDLHTRERQYILPKTVKGKEKKITPTNLLSPDPTGCVFYTSLKREYISSSVSAYCPRNCIHLPITEADNIATITELKKWLNHYIKTCPPDYFDKVSKMRNMPHKTIKYKIGDVFKFEIDRENYGFGIIIGKLRELEKAGVFCENHPMHDVMTMPIFIRLFKIKTKNKDLPLSDIITNELLPTDIMADNEIIWGTHDIVGNKMLEEADIDFPMQFGQTLNYKTENIIRFAWGVGMITIDNISTVPAELRTNKYLKHSVATSVPLYDLNRVFEGRSVYDIKSDLRHPDNAVFKEKVFDLFGLEFNMGIDEFNMKYKGMTRKQYINYIYNSK